MRTIVTIDNGNTNPHYGLFQEDSLVHVMPLEAFEESEDNTFYISSSVGAKERIEKFNAISIRQLFKDKQFLDMPVDYSQTLGEDRLAVCYYAFKKFEGNTLVIDAGTFITVDLVTDDGHKGGYIFPGLKTSLDSYQKGSLLPHLKTPNANDDLDLDNLPKNTEEAILKAVTLQLKSSLKYIIDQLKPDNLLITGGQGEHVKVLLSGEVNAIVDRDLIHKSLYLIAKNILAF